MKTAGSLLILMGMAGIAVAGGVTVPEIDAASGAGALTLLSGALLIIRARRNRN